jgi:feruloyl-CoA synthase
MVTPGYLHRPDLTAAAFDADGFYRTGDAGQPVSDRDPGLGLLFRGRLAEDFKLTSGTFVRVGALRSALLSAVPVLADAVIAGEDRDYVAALAWLNAAEARRLLGREPTVEGDLVRDPELAGHLAAALAAHAGETGSAGHVERLVVLSRPAALDAGEITDKGYVNQRRVLHNRAGLVDLVYADPVEPGVVTHHERTP